MPHNIINIIIIIIIIIRLLEVVKRNHDMMSGYKQPLMAHGSAKLHHRYWTVFNFSLYD